MADPHTTDLADRLEHMAQGRAFDCWTLHGNPNVPSLIGYVPDPDCCRAARDAADLRAAAAELRRLRHRDAALTRLLDAVGDANELRRAAVSVGRDRKVTSAEAERRILTLARIAAAVEDIDQEHER